MAEDRLLGRLWGALAAFYALLVLYLVLYWLLPDKGSGSLFRVLALGFVGLSAGVGAVALAFRRPVVQAARQRLAAIPPGVTLLAACAALLAFGIGLRPEWVYVHMSLAASGLAALLYVTLYGGRLPRVPRSVVIAGVVVVLGAVVVIRARALVAHPTIHILDEPWTLSWAVSYLHAGEPSDWIVAHVSGSPFYSLPRYYALVAGWLRLVGVGLWEGRLFSLLLTALAVALTTLAARNLFDRRTAAATLLALVASSVVPVGLRLRHDIGVELAIAASLWVYSLARPRESLRLHALAGGLMGLGVAAHYHALGFSAALLAGLYLPDYVDRLRRRQYVPQPEALAYACGALASGTLVMAVQALPDIEQFRMYMAPRSTRSVGEFARSLVYHIEQIPGHSRLEAALIALAVGAALVRRTRLDVTLLLALAVGYLALAVMASKKYGPFDYYSVPLTPLMGLLVGRLWGGLRFRGRSSAVVVGSLCFLLPQLGYSLHAPLDYLRSGGPLRLPPRPAAQWVLDNVPHDRSVAAEHLYFLWLHDYPFYSPLTPDYLPPERKAAFGGLETPDERVAAWAALAPDVVIIDPTLATTGLLDPLRDTGFLDRQGYVAAAQYDTVTVYMRALAQTRDGP